MDEVSSHAPGADSEEKHEPVSDIDTVLVDSLKALDPEWPIREAELPRLGGIQPVIATSCLSAVNGAIPDNFWLNGKQRFRKIRHSINP